jgi:hypothetical protein
VLGIKVSPSNLVQEHKKVVVNLLRLVEDRLDKVLS